MKLFATILTVATIFLLTHPAGTNAQQSELPENMVFYINQHMDGSSTARSIIRSDLSGQQKDTLGIAFGNIISMGYVPETDEYIVADNQRSRILHLSSDFTSYRVVNTNRDLVFAVAHDVERGRYFYSRTSNMAARRGVRYFDEIGGQSIQLDSRTARYMVFHADSNAVYYALNGVGLLKHQMDRDERSTLISYTNVTTGMAMDYQRGHLYLVYANNLYRYDLNDPDAEPEFLFVMGFGSQTEIAMSFDSENEVMYSSAQSGFSRNILYETPINNLDAEIDFTIPFTQELNHVHYNPVRHEIVFTNGGNNSPFSFLRGYDLETKKVANYGLRDVTDIAVDPDTQTIYGIDRFFVLSSRTILFKMNNQGTDREIMHEFVYEQREIKYDSLANRLFIMGYSDSGSFDNIWEYDLNDEEATPVERLRFEKNFPGVWRIQSFDVDYENDVIYVSVDGEGILACAADAESCELILAQGDRFFGSGLAYNPVDEVIYFEDNDIGIASVNRDGTGLTTFMGDFNPIYGLQYNGVMGKVVWASAPFVGAPSLRYRNPQSAENVGSTAFFSGRDVRGMSFVIGNPTTVSVEEGLSISLPQQLNLMQNFPNPFNPSTSIRFELAETTDIRLSVYDITGRLIEVLEQGVRSAGQHEVAFDASSLSSGIYIYRLETPGQTQTMKMTLIK
ncbi:MAG: T9SS type A sorting domain-containing protein [Balneolales bacterium]|nr:T9SS type A sorting domain-containing protein [Balneolales bacterium]